MNIYGIYDLKNKEQCVRVGTLQEIVKFLGVTARSFGALLRGKKYKNRFQVVYLYREDV